MGFEPINE
jgi:hypothetical protein